MKVFGRDFSYLDISDKIGYFAVFEGYHKKESLHKRENLLENIKYNILYKYHDLKDDFIFTNDFHLQVDIETLLFRIAVGSRKSLSIYKNDISQHRGRELYKLLFDKGIIQKEYSRERPLPKIPKRFLKKELRHYRIEDKIKFSHNFTRFWFTFITPYQDQIALGEFDLVTQHIAQDLDKFISFTFEELSNQLIQKTFKKESITEVGTYWDKDIELDLLAKTKSGLTIAGECKWKNQRISKNILNKLEKKCTLAKLHVDYFALFSKSGFSNELIKSHPKNVLLFDINSFKQL